MQVDGAELKYHFCKIIPTDSKLFSATNPDTATFETKKIKVETIGSVDLQIYNRI